MIDVESEESGYIYFLFKKHHKPKIIHFYPAVPSMSKKKKMTIVAEHLKIKFDKLSQKQINDWQNTIPCGTNVEPCLVKFRNK